MAAPMDLRDWLCDNGVTHDAESGEWAWKGDRYTWTVPDAVIEGLDAHSVLFVTGELEKWKMADAGYCASCGVRAGADLDDLALCGECSAEFNAGVDPDDPSGAPVPAPKSDPVPEAQAPVPDPVP